ncbi:MAG: hypothetical protein NXI16_05250 [Alphaproteobacteria bacterium]|nr:hypothetical protein [Alphaproteobacteria bacterium]
MSVAKTNLRCEMLTLREDRVKTPNGVFISGVHVKLPDLIGEAVAGRLFGDEAVRTVVGSKQAKGEIRRPLFLAGSIGGYKAVKQAVGEIERLRLTDLGKLDLEDGKLQQTPKTATETDFFSAHVAPKAGEQGHVVECGVVRFILTDFLSYDSVVTAFSDRWMLQFMAKLDLFPVFLMEDPAYFEVRDLLPLFHRLGGELDIPIVLLANFRDRRAQNAVLEVLGVDPNAIG